MGDLLFQKLTQTSLIWNHVGPQFHHSQVIDRIWTPVDPSSDRTGVQVMREFSPFSVLVDLSDVAFLEMGEWIVENLTR